MKIYSPSQTMTFARCRWKWYLSKYAGVVESTILKRDLAAAFGTGIGAALCMYYKGDIAYEKDDIAQVAAATYEADLKSQIDKGRVLAGLNEEILYPSLIPKVIQKYWKNPGVEDHWKTEGVEYRCGEDNKSYIDWWGYDERGLLVLDWKCKMSCKPAGRDYEIIDYSKSWQMAHYIWSLYRHLGEWPTRYRINMLFGTPTSESRWMDFEVEPDWMNWWMASSQSIWAEMEVAEEALAKAPVGLTPVELASVVPMAPTHKDGFWKCEYHEICTRYAGDYASTPGFITIERK